MKLSVIDGSALSAQPQLLAGRHMLATRLLGVHRALGCAGAAGGVDQQRQRVVGVAANNGPAAGSAFPRSSTSASVSTTTGLPASASRARAASKRLALVVDLGAVVEHDQPRGRVAGQHQFDGVVEIVDARGDHAGSVSATMGRSWVTGALVCSGTDTAPSVNQRHVDDRVVDAGEAEDATRSPGTYAGQGARDAPTRSHSSR